MDSKFIIGIAVGVVATLLQYVVKAMPSWLAYSGITAGIFIIILAMLPNNNRIPWHVTLLSTTTVAMLVASICLGKIYYFDRYSAATPSKTSSQSENSRADNADSLPHKAGNQDQKPLTMRQIFDSDFDGLAKIKMMSVFKRSGQNSDFAFSELIDIQTNSYFLAFYFDSPDVAYINRDYIALRVANIARQLGQVSFSVTTPGDSFVASNETLSFSKQIYIYLDGTLSLGQLFELEKSFTLLGYQVHIRDMSYEVLHWNEHDRYVVSATQPGSAGQLPAVPIGTDVRILNQEGTQPFWSEGAPLPPLR